MNHPKSFMLSAGAPFLSVVSRVDMFERTKGLMKAINSVAEECIPNVPEKASMVRPVKNPISSNIHPGVSKGSSIMNRI